MKCHNWIKGSLAVYFQSVCIYVIYIVIMKQYSWFIVLLTDKPCNMVFFAQMTVICETLCCYGIWRFINVTTSSTAHILSQFKQLHIFTISLLKEPLQFYPPNYNFIFQLLSSHKVFQSTFYIHFFFSEYLFGYSH